LLGGATGALTKTGAGTLQFASTSGTYGGVTFVNQGFLESSSQNTGFGDSVGKTVVNNGATLRLTGAGPTPNEPLELNGNGVNGTNGALQITSGSASLYGSVTLASPASIRTDGVIHHFGAIAGGANLRLTGPGEYWTHGAANTLTGDITVESGFFVLDKQNGISAVPTTVIVGTNGLLGGAAATLRNFESNQITGAVIINNGASWELPVAHLKGIPALHLTARRGQVTAGFLQMCHPAVPRTRHC